MLLLFALSGTKMLVTYYFYLVIKIERSFFWWTFHNVWISRRYRNQVSKPYTIGKCKQNYRSLFLLSKSYLCCWGIFLDIYSKTIRMAGHSKVLQRDLSFSFEWQRRSHQYVEVQMVIWRITNRFHNSALKPFLGELWRCFPYVAVKQSFFLHVGLQT